MTVMDKHKEIVSFCFGGYPGTNRQLRELSRTVGLSRHFVLTAGTQSSPETIFFGDLLLDTQPSLVIFGGWAPAYESLLNTLPQSNSLGAILWTSSPGQVDISGEARILARILQEPRIEFFLFASSSFGSSLNGNLKGCYELPHTLEITDDIQGFRSSNDSVQKPTIISLFCSPNEYRRKNVLNTLIALAGVKGDYLLYVNGIGKSPEYEPLLQFLNIPYKDLGWMETKDYQKIFDEIDLGLQLSFSDSFNYVVADHLLKGIPVITSEAIPLMHGISNSLKEVLVVGNEDDPQEIRKKIQALVDHPSTRHKAGQAALTHLKQANRRRIDQVRTTLESLLQICKGQKDHEQSNRFSKFLSHS